MFAAIELKSNQFFSFSSDSMVVKVAVVQPNCNNPNSGTMTANISGGVTPYNYYWSATPPQTIPAQTNLPATNISSGSYNLNVLMGGICVSAYPVTIIINQHVIQLFFNLKLSSSLKL